MDIDEEERDNFTTESGQQCRTVKTSDCNSFQFQDELSSLGNAKQAQKPRKRRVSFPDDHSIISKAVEPVDPWADVSNATSAEVIKAYINACGRLRVKPVDKLIKQLKEHLVFQSRLNCLDLKGVKLDLKSCEAMEEVFKKVQFFTLDIENTNLEDEGAIALVEMIEFYQSALHIHIGYNPRIKTRGWQTFSQMVRKAPFVEFIDLRHCTLNDTCAALMARSLKLNATLRVVHLEGNNLSGRLLIILCTGLKLNQTLSEVFLGDNFLVPADATTLAAMLKLNHTLQLLDVRNNMLQDQGLMQLCEGLCQQSSKGGMKTLVLWNNQITRNGMVPLSNYLAFNHVIQTINVGHNRLGNDGIRNLQVGLLKNRSLLRLGLLNTKITAEGAVALAEYIADTRTLLRLDLRENDLFVGGLMALTLAVKINESVVRIDLDKDLKKEQGMEGTQTALLVDIYQHLERNKKSGIEREEEKRRKREMEIEQNIAKESKERNEITPSVFESGPLSPDETSVFETPDSWASVEGNNSRFTVCRVLHEHKEIVLLKSVENMANLPEHTTVVVNETTQDNFESSLGAESLNDDINNIEEQTVTSRSGDERLHDDSGNINETEELTSRNYGVSGDTKSIITREQSQEFQNNVEQLSDEFTQNNVEQPGDELILNNVEPITVEQPRPLEVSSDNNEQYLQEIPDTGQSTESPNDGEILRETSGKADNSLPETSNFEEIWEFSSSDLLLETTDELTRDFSDIDDSLEVSFDVNSHELLSSNTMVNDSTELLDAQRHDEEENSSSEEFDKEMDELLANVSGVKIDFTDLPSPQDDDDFWSKDMKEILGASAH